MNELINHVQTMSSLDIAKLTSKNHGDVLRDIRVIFNECEIDQSTFASIYLDSMNREKSCFMLPKREALLITSSYSAKQRLKIIDRWQELEGTPGNVHFLIPKTLPEALRLAADLADKNEVLQAKIEADAPKVEFHDKVCEAVNGQTIQEVAKVLGTGQNRLFQWFRREGLLMPNNQPYQEFIDRGYFRVTQRQYTDPRGESHTYTRTLVTGRGLSYVQKRFMAEAA